MYTQLDEINLTNDLLCVLGLSVNRTDNILIEQETNNPFLFENKNIKATNNLTKQAFIGPNDIKLEPVNPKCVKLMNRLFGYFLDKACENGDLMKAVSFNFDEADKEAGTYVLVVKFADGSKFFTPPWRNRSLLYTEAIMDLDGSFPPRDYSIFEIDEDVDTRR